jgi:hypothetical protein
MVSMAMLFTLEQSRTRVELIAIRLQSLQPPSNWGRSVYPTDTGSPVELPSTISKAGVHGVPGGARVRCTADIRVSPAPNAVHLMNVGWDNADVQDWSQPAPAEVR